MNNINSNPNVLAIGGSSLRYIMKSIFADEFKQIFRGTTPSLLDPEVLQPNYYSGHGLTDKFIAENIYTRRNLEIVKNHYDFVFIECLRDIVCRTVFYKNSAFTDPTSIKSGFDFDLGSLFVDDYRLMTYLDPDFFDLFRKGFDHLLDSLIKFGQSKKETTFFLIKLYPAKYSFHPENGVVELGGRAEYESNIAFLEKAYSYIEDKYRFIRCISLDENLRFASNTSPYGVNPFHYNTYCYMDMKAKILREMNRDVSDFGLLDLLKSDMNLVTNELRTIISAVNNLNVKTDLLIESNLSFKSHK